MTICVVAVVVLIVTKDNRYMVVYQKYVEAAISLSVFPTEISILVILVLVQMDFDFPLLVF